jgi:hypothetical protein
MRSELELGSKVGRRDNDGIMALEFDANGSERSWSVGGLLAKMCRREAISAGMRRRKASMQTDRTIRSRPWRSGTPPNSRNSRQFATRSIYLPAIFQRQSRRARWWYLKGRMIQDLVLNRKVLHQEKSFSYITAA